uniref:C2H2-type domain-containing protein n=1 Tax=viral metagenome TaxID=1070528 RepID=A0A6C0B966_9ZZZZ
MPKTADNFYCEKCDFICSKSSNWAAHLSTRKHQMVRNDNSKTAEKNIHCICGRSFSFTSGLSRHRKTCSFVQSSEQIETSESVTTTTNINTEIISEILKQNSEFKTLLIEQQNKIMEQNTKIMEMAKPTNVITNNTTNNTQFNLNVFLNETCKDALNMVDFVNNIKLEIKDLENVGHYGYIEGITNIIMKNLNTIEVSKRPIHCTDLKRETMYIKDDDKWNKDNAEKTKLKKLIGRVADKNLQQLQQWRELNPECLNPEHQKYDFCIDMYKNALGGYGEEEQNKFDDKIIRNVAKHVLVDKNTP